MAAHRSRVIVSLAAAAAVALGVAVAVLRVSAQGPAVIPTKDDGYDISQPSTSQSAPEGFEGRKETSTLTAVGNKPATMGKKVVAKFVFDNQIRTCPTADGAAEGEGEFSITADGTENGASTFHIAMRAKAKYKGKVNDDAYLDGPVKAEIDYSYVGPGANATQHITVPFLVGPGLSTPSFGALSGGDPTHGQLSDAFTVGTALSYWAGIYYSTAQLKWRTGKCVQLWFTPPEKTVQPALGTQVRVQALVKTKRGEGVPAKFIEVHAFDGSVTPPRGATTDASPALTFTYTAPSQKPRIAGPSGFKVGVTSRAGVTEKDWDAKLGTNWSGQISCTREDKGEPYSDEQVSGAGYEVTRIQIEVNDGVVFATGYAEKNSSSVMRRPVARQGYVFDTSSSQVGIVEGSRQGALEVSISPNGAYRISPVFREFDRGKLHYQRCDRNGCEDKDLDYGIQSCLNGLSGTTDNPNQLHGSRGDSQTRTSGNTSMTQSYSVNWDLARQGTTK